MDNVRNLFNRIIPRHGQDGTQSQPQPDAQQQEENAVAEALRPDPVEMAQDPVFTHEAPPESGPSATSPRDIEMEPPPLAAADDSDDDMPPLQDVSDTDSDFSDGDDDDNSVVDDNSDNHSGMPPLIPIRRQRSRSAGDGVGDRDRDRRHPSQRAGDSNNETTQPTPPPNPPPTAPPTQGVRPPRFVPAPPRMGPFHWRDRNGNGMAVTLDVGPGVIPADFIFPHFGPGGAIAEDGQLQTLLDFLLQLGGGHGSEEPDPERAKRLVDAMEEVPLGLMKRLERVGEEGDTMCAICWDKLMGAEAKFGEENSSMAVDPPGEAPEPSSSAQPESTASPSDKAKEDAAEDTRIVSLPCSHIFHASCLIPWFSRPKQTTCPSCRFDVDPDNLTWRPPPPRQPRNTNTNDTPPTVGQQPQQGEEPQTPSQPGQTMDPASEAVPGAPGETVLMPIDVEVGIGIGDPPVGWFAVPLNPNSPTSPAEIFANAPVPPRTNGPEGQLPFPFVRSSMGGQHLNSNSQPGAPSSGGSSQASNSSASSNRPQPYTRPRAVSFTDGAAAFGLPFGDIAHPSASSNNSPRPAGDTPQPQAAAASAAAVMGNILRNQLNLQSRAPQGPLPFGPIPQFFRSNDPPRTFHDSGPPPSSRSQASGPPQFSGLPPTFFTPSPSSSQQQSSGTSSSSASRPEQAPRPPTLEQIPRPTDFMAQFRRQAEESYERLRAAPQWHPAQQPPTQQSQQQAQQQRQQPEQNVPGTWTPPQPAQQRQDQERNTQQQGNLPPAGQPRYFVDTGHNEMGEFVTIGMDFVIDPYFMPQGTGGNANLPGNANAERRNDANANTANANASSNSTPGQNGGGVHLPNFTTNTGGAGAAGGPAAQGRRQSGNTTSRPTAFGGFIIGNPFERIGERAQESSEATAGTGGAAPAANSGQEEGQAPNPFEGLTFPADMFSRLMPQPSAQPTSPSSGNPQRPNPFSPSNRPPNVGPALFNGQVSFGNNREAFIRRGIPIPGETRPAPPNRSEPAADTPRPTPAPLNTNHGQHQGGNLHPRGMNTPTPVEFQEMLRRFLFNGEGPGGRTGPAPPRSAESSPQPPRAYVAPAPPGLTLRQRVEKLEKEHGLRCWEPSCGVAPADEEPGIEVKERQVHILLPLTDEKGKGKELVGDDRKNACEHTFHPSCLVSAQRVRAVTHNEEIDETADEILVVCDLCRTSGIVEQSVWSEGAKSLDANV